MPHLDVRVGERHGDQITVVVEGELDLASAPLLRAMVAGSRQARRVVLDLSRLDFCDSAGLQAIVETEQVLASEGASLQLANPSPLVARVLALTGLDRHFAVTATPADWAGLRLADPVDAPEEVEVTLGANACGQRAR